MRSAIAALILIASSQAFQPTSSFGVRVANHESQSTRRITVAPSISPYYKRNGRPVPLGMSNPVNAQNYCNRNATKSSLFQKRFRPIAQKLRQSFTILLASLAIFLSSTHIHSAPAHASTVAVASKTSTSLLSKINPFKPRSASELIDKYVQDRLFADDEFDPVESAYREAFSDYPTQGEGYYPTLVADTAASALGRKDGSQFISKATSVQSDEGGITGALMKASDILQQRLKVSSSVSYYIIAAGLLLGATVLPGIVGMSYQVFQRLQIDKSEMKMYGKITE